MVENENYTISVTPVANKSVIINHHNAVKFWEAKVFAGDELILISQHREEDFAQIAATMAIRRHIKRLTAK